MRHQIFHLDDYTEGLAGIRFFQEDNEPDSRHIAMVRTLKRVFLGELTPRQRECLYLYHCKNKNMAEISVLLGINPSTVSRHIQKAHVRLYKILDYFYLENRDLSDKKPVKQ